MGGDRIMANHHQKQNGNVAGTAVRTEQVETRFNLKPVTVFSRAASHESFL
jgi:hypothetical protein